MTILGIATQNDKPLETSISCEWFLNVLQLCIDGAWFWQSSQIKESIYVSEKIKTRLGYEESSYAGETREWWFENIHPEDLESLKNFRNDCYTNLTKTQCEIEIRVRHRHGHYIWLLMACHLERDENNNLIRAGGSFTDISSYRMLHTQLEKTIEEAEAISQGKSKFIATLNHELRTPLNGVLGMLSLLREMPTSPEQNHCFDNIEQSAEMMLALVNDILDVSKIAAGKLELEEIPFALTNSIGHTVDLIKPAASKKNLVFQTLLDPNLPQELLGDRTRFQQILINLMNNAVKFTESGSIRLNVILKSIDDSTCTIQFEVIDSGIGISEENIAKLFNDFTQAHAAINRHYGGTGLGLSICKKLINLMHGEIGVHSTIGKGTTFWFEIPFKIIKKTHEPLQNQASPQIIVANTDTVLVSQDETNILPNNMAIPAPQQIPEFIPIQVHAASQNEQDKTLRILMAEDNKINQEVMLGLIHLLGDHVDVANNGQEAVDAFSTKDYDIILMDINMPVMDGLTAAMKIRSMDRGKTIPIIAVTANTIVSDRQNCLANGMTDVVNKPVNKNILESILNPYRKFFKTEEEAVISHQIVSEQAAYQIINHETISGLINDLGVETIERLFTIYKRDVQQMLNQLKSAAQIKEQHDIAHTLAGMSENLGIQEIGRTARAIMMLSEKEPAKIPDLLTCLEKQYEIVRHEMSALLTEHTPSEHHA